MRKIPTRTQPNGKLVLAGFALLLILFAMAIAQAAAPVSTAAALNWTSLDGPRGGPAQALAISPTFAADQLVFGGGGRDYGRASWAGRGIFRSTNHGYSWDWSGGPPNGAIFDIAFSPEWANDGTAVAALWQGVWITDNGGTSWHELSSMASGGPSLVATVDISPQFASDHTLLAGGSWGIVYRSTNAGATWATVPGPSSVRRVKFNPGNGSIALVAAANGLWRSTNGGATLSQVVADTQIYDVGFRPGHDTAYATYDDQVWRSTNSGVSWGQFGTQADAALRSARHLGGWRRPIHGCGTDALPF